MYLQIKKVTVSCVHVGNRLKQCINWKDLMKILIVSNFEDHILIINIHEKNRTRETCPDNRGSTVYSCSSQKCTCVLKGKGPKLSKTCPLQ